MHHDNKLAQTKISYLITLTSIKHLAVHNRIGYNEVLCTSTAPVVLREDTNLCCKQAWYNASFDQSCPASTPMQSDRCVMPYRGGLWTYKQQWFGNIRADVLAGITVALALIPEAIGFSIIAGVDPMVGLYASICIAIVISLAGGRPGMISAATGAIAVLVGTLVAQHGRRISVCGYDSGRCVPDYTGLAADRTLYYLYSAVGYDGLCQCARHRHFLGAVAAVCGRQLDDVCTCRADARHYLRIAPVHQSCACTARSDHYRIAANVLSASGCEDGGRYG